MKKKYNSYYSLIKGFTLIEVIIIISLVGILNLSLHKIFFTSIKLSQIQNVKIGLLEDRNRGFSFIKSEIDKSESILSIKDFKDSSLFKFRHPLNLGYVLKIKKGNKYIYSTYYIEESTSKLRRLAREIEGDLNRLDDLEGRNLVIENVEKVTINILDEKENYYKLSIRLKKDGLIEEEDYIFQIGW